MKEQWLIFRLGRQRYCAQAASIREIITYRPANPVPGAPPGVEGIITVRADKITLFSGAKLVEHRDAPPQEDGHIILLESEGGLFGVTVDGVDGIVELDSDQIDPSSVTQDAAVLGTIPFEEGAKGKQLLTAVSLVAFCENAVAEQNL